MEELHGMLAQQEQKYQSMLHQVFSHMTQMQAGQFQAAANPQYLSAEPSRVEEDQRMDQMAFAEVQRINADYYQDRLAERAECQYGHTNLTSEQWARLQEGL